MLPSANTFKPTEGAPVGSILPPSYPLSQPNTVGGDASEDLDVEIKSVKSLNLQSYHVSVCVTTFTKLACLFYFLGIM